MQEDIQIFLLIITGTVLLLFLVGFIILSLLFHQRAQHKHLQAMNDMKNQYEQEILKAQLEVQEEAYLTISQEIHDNIGQLLSLIRLNISTIKPDDYVFNQRKITSSKELLDQVIEDLRALSKRLNPQYISQQNLSDSLKAQIELIQKSELYETYLEILGQETLLDPQKKLIIFRIAQEALNNIIKHAKAKKIWLILSYLPNQIILNIRDDGTGFKQESEAASFQQGLGTQNMRYRAQLIGADFQIHSQSGDGTIVQLSLPLNA